MKKCWIGIFLFVTGCAGIHGAPPEERTALYILETAQAFRTVHANGVAEQATRAGITPKEDWGKDDHAIMLPIQFIKAAGSEIHDFALRLIGQALIYRLNFSQTPAEAEALRKLRANPQQKLVTSWEPWSFESTNKRFSRNTPPQTDAADT